MAIRALLGKHVAPWRFMMFFAFLIGAGCIAVQRFDLGRATLIAFDVAALAFLLSCLTLFNDRVEKIREIARDTDANRTILLILAFLLTVVIFAAIIAELGKGYALTKLDKAFVAISLVLVWLFANAVYTLHYCHLFYTSTDGGKDAAGLDFPDTDEPLMSDFVYFAFTLGVAVQTADVAVTSPHIRKIVTAHCVAGFFFNLGVMALTINVLSSS